MIPRIAVPATPIQNCRSRANRINFYGLREEIETNDHPATVKILAKFYKTHRYISAQRPTDFKYSADHQIEPSHFVSP
jgi:hypothetical protein